MGCHTWYFEKIETPTKQELKEMLLNKIRENLNQADEVLNRGGYEDGRILSSKSIELYVGWKIELIADRNALVKNKIKRHQSLLRMYQDRLNGHRHLRIKNKKLYEGTSEMLSLFRTNWNETILYSHQETLNFIANNRCYSFHEDKDKLLKEFWDKHPDGFIEFG